VVSTSTSGLANLKPSPKARSDELDLPLVCDGPNPPPATTRRAMRFVRWFAPGWAFSSCVLLIAVLVNARRPPPLPRSFLELSSEEISSLVDGKDPLKNLDPNDPNSHLSKILIPRPGKHILCLRPVTRHDNTFLSSNSGYCE